MDADLAARLRDICLALHRGWIGVRLDGDADWTELAELCADAYRAVAPPRLIVLLDDAR